MQECRITKIDQKTANRYLNFFELDVENRKGRPSKYYVASRRTSPDEMELTTGRQHVDGVIIFSLYGEQHDRVVLIRQYRYPINGYIYEFPAGLVEPGEDYHASAIREMKEETGLTLHPITVDPAFERPYYTTIGMTDECCGTVYGYAEGSVSDAMPEDSEQIEVVLADREEVKRILREERVAIVCAYMLTHFLQEGDTFGFLNSIGHENK